MITGEEKISTYEVKCYDGVRIKSLHRSRGFKEGLPQSGGGRRCQLRHVSWRSLWLLGPNGAGKYRRKDSFSLVAPTKGTIRILGQPINNREMRRRIGYLPELPHSINGYARDFLAFHGHLYVCAAWN
jgi:hypothetical protein